MASKIAKPNTLAIKWLGFCNGVLGLASITVTVHHCYCWFFRIGIATTRNLTGIAQLSFIRYLENIWSSLHWLFFGYLYYIVELFWETRKKKKKKSNTILHITNIAVRYVYLLYNLNNNIISRNKEASSYLQKCFIRICFIIISIQWQWLHFVHRHYYYKVKKKKNI